MNNDKLREATQLYTAGYKSGHNDTVESRYVEIDNTDVCTYLQDDVKEFVPELTSLFPAPVDDKALAEAMVQLAEVRYRANSIDGYAIDTVITALRAAQQEVAELQEWKRQQLEVWSSWDVQAVGKLLGVPLGKSIHPYIAPGIEALQSQVKELRKDKERLDWLEATKEFLTAWDSPGDNSTSMGWTIGSIIYGKHISGKTAREAIDKAIDKARAAGEGKGAT